MKKRLTTIAALALVAGTLFGTSGAVSAAPAGCNGKELNKRDVGFGGSDITGGVTTFVASGDGSTYDITLDIVLASMSCTDVTYTATLYDPKTGAPTTPIGTAEAFGDDATDRVSVGPITVATTSLAQTTTGQTCVSLKATTSNGTKLLDSAPDSGTFVFCDPDNGGRNFQ